PFFVPMSRGSIFGFVFSLFCLKNAVAGETQPDSDFRFVNNVVGQCFVGLEKFGGGFSTAFIIIKFTQCFSDRRNRNADPVHL
ncbi:MAG: hypothetical protein WB559_10075, partial [Candidatus Acidiferrales bacterium]